MLFKIPNFMGLSQNPLLLSFNCMSSTLPIKPNRKPVAEILPQVFYLLFIAGSDFIKFIPQKLQLGSNCTIADAESVGSSFPFVFAKLGFHKAAFTVCRQHFIDFINNGNFFHFVTS